MTNNKYKGSHEESDTVNECMEQLRKITDEYPDLSVLNFVCEDNKLNTLQASQRSTDLYFQIILFNSIYSFINNESESMETKIDRTHTFLCCFARIINGLNISVEEITYYIEKERGF